jgi:arginine decarboxylase
MRVKLAARGAGRWQSSGGYRSKFGLTVTEVLKALDMLKSRGMEDCFKLLHFHLGSQITNIRHVKGALIEASRIYVDLAKRGAALEYLDVGGGLGVDYDGSRTNFESSVNYTLQEYANDVIYHVLTVCDDAEIPHPTIISESGRAIAAYHSVLIFNVLGIASFGDEDLPAELSDDVEQPLRDLQNTYVELNVRNVLESFHDAQQALDMAISAFAAGYMPLDQRSTAEQLFWAICRKICKFLDQLEFVPEELEKLHAMLAETYFCNFSLFQSLPDSWAIKQLFPVMPIHRLNEEPTHRAILGDITCDSDGKIDSFIDRRGVCKTLALHGSNGQPYYLGVFLLGAYQEILGDLHNLFGDTNAAHISTSEQGDFVIETIIKGDTVTEVLDYVQFSGAELLSKLQTAVETAVLKNRIGQEEAGEFLRLYEEGLRGYTYLQ